MNKMRDEFEALAHKQGYNLTKTPQGEYAFPAANGAWFGYCAALARVSAGQEKCNEDGPPAASQQCAELPTLPQATVSTRHGTPCYTEDQLREYGKSCSKAARQVPAGAVSDCQIALSNLVEALDGAFISSWQSTHAWKDQLDAARDLLAATTQGDKQ